ncbi:hypothetical protein [Arthrobacter sp. MYb222]|uniref:hypothetical protein n=1 Tax=Arthrobacter sp. MYb222 TaxID=1848599 RepID=UPI0011B0516C|nr:hypothetical protein [Arthrobacter sp. MYb222]
MFIGIWEAKSSVPADRSLSDPVGFLNDYSELLWGVEDESVERAWLVNDAGSRDDFHSSVNAPDYWFQVGVRAAAANATLPCYALTVLADTFRSASSSPLAHVDFAVPLQQLKNLNSGVLPSEGLSGVVGLETNENRRDISVEVLSGHKNAFSDDVLNSLASRISTALAIEVGSRCTFSKESPPISDGIWNGPGVSSALLSFSSGLHSLPSIGWMTGLIAEILASNGIDHPVYISWKFSEKTSDWPMLFHKMQTRFLGFLR